MAWHTRLNKHVVMKVVENCSDTVIQAHRNEVEALKNIKSIHIPQVLDFFIEGKKSYTIMEYIDGVSFDKLLRFGQEFSQSQVITWYIHLASALSVIHKHDICHRDIKPANIMRTANAEACLIDFNSAFVSGNYTGVVSRSMGYASPEQYEYFKMCRSLQTAGTKEGFDYNETALLTKDCKTAQGIVKNSAGHITPCYIDWKLSDIYSLGATVFHLLTRKRPPVKADEVVLISKQKGYPERLLSIIEQSMQTEPSCRFTSAEELCCTLRSLARS